MISRDVDTKDVSLLLDDVYSERCSEMLGLARKYT
jgi:hypothetical protein